MYLTTPHRALHSLTHTLVESPNSLQFVHTKQFKKKRRNHALLFRQGAVANFVPILSNIVLLDAQLCEWEVGPRMNVG